MAEGGTFSQSVLRASEEIYDFNCSPCEEDGVYKEAHKYCDNCHLYYCEKCLKDHNRFPALRGHLVTDVTFAPKHMGLRVSDIAQATEACENHPQEMIKMYCGEHDHVCCTVCIALDHRECKGVHYIMKLAKGIRKSQEYTNYVSEIMEIGAKNETTKKSIQDELEKLDHVKKAIINEIKEYKRELVERIEELERKSIENVNERYKQVKERMSATVISVEELLGKVAYLERETYNASESNVFVNMKRMKVMKDKCNEIDKSLFSFEGLSFSIDENIKNALYNVEELTSINLPVKIRYRSKYDITSDDDKFIDFRVYDMSLLDDGTIVMTCGNRLKRFSRTFKKLESIPLPGESFGVCCTSSSRELAVTIRDTGIIQFVKYDSKSMSLTKSFKIGLACKGICCIDDSLFVSCGGGIDKAIHGLVRKYDMKGNLISQIDTDDTGQRIFTSPRLMTIDFKTHDVYIADRYNGIIVLDKNGKITSHPYEHFLKNGFGISLTSRNHRLVSGCDSRNIHQYDEKSRYIGSILSFLDEEPKPLFIHLDEVKKQVIVSFAQYGYVHVYDIMN